MHSKRKQWLFALFCIAAAVFLAGAVWMGRLVVQNSKLYRDKSSPKYDILSNYASIGISPEISLDAETQYNLDLACLALFRQTNDTALLCCPGNALLLYMNSINYNYAYLAKEDLLATDYLLSVNNHYLALNPIFGMDGKPLSAPEDEVGVTVLVPDNFPLPKEELRKELQALANMWYYFPEDQHRYGTEKASSMQHEPLPLHLVDYPAGQQAFLYRPYSTVHLHEALTDPLLWIVTQGNADSASQTFYLTNEGYLPAIPPGATAQEGLKPVLASSGLLQYVSRCYAYEEARQDTLRTLAPVLRLQIVLFAALVLGFLLWAVLVWRRGAQLLRCRG